MANAKRPKDSTTRPRPKLAEEWVGGRRLLPSFIMEDPPYRPELVLWLDVTNDLIVASEAFKPGKPLSVEAELLASAMKTPIAGKPRRPSSIRVADPALAALLRGRLDADVRIEVAETPELDRVIELMGASMGGEAPDASYLEGGKVSADTVRRFFSAAARLWKMAPWKNVYDSQLLRLDCPALDARGKVVSIIGNLGESFGVLVFDSLDGFDAMAEYGDAHMAGRQMSSLGTNLFSINFERGSDIPQSMRREIDRHGWKVPAANAYPCIQWIDPDHVLRPLAERDVVFATACAEAVTEFFARHGNDIAGGTFKQASERITLEDLPGLPTVELSAPHPGRAWGEPDGLPDDEAKRGAELGRARSRWVWSGEGSPPDPKAPCPCGSGKRYRKCCMPR